MGNAALHQKDIGADGPPGLCQPPALVKKGQTWVLSDLKETDSAPFTGHLSL